MAIVRKDKMLAGYHGNLESVVVSNNADSATIETTNGVFVVVGDLIEGQRETKKARLGAIKDVALDVLLVHSPEVMYDERLSKLADFKISKDKVARAYHLYDGDIITLTDDLFDDSVVADGKVTTRPVYSVGTKLLIKKDGKLGKDSTTPVIGNAKVVFTVIEDSGNELDTEMGAFAVQVSRQ